MFDKVKRLKKKKEGKPGVAKANSVKEFPKQEDITQDAAFFRMPTDSSTWGGNLVSKEKRTHRGLILESKKQVCMNAQQKPIPIFLAGGCAS